MSTRVAVAQAYKVLGLQEGVSLDVVRSTYKQIALRTHPDKNANDPNATARFQEVGEAYNLLVNYLSSPSYNEDDDYDYDYDSDDYDEYDEHSDSEFWDDFYLHLFESFMRGHRHYYSRSQYRREQKETKETPEQYAERLRRTSEAQVAAAERRRREEAARKERQEQDRRKESLAAEQRHKAKAEEKKAHAEILRKQAKDTAQAQRKKVQTARTAVFQAARMGAFDKVKKGIWEDNIDAAGGEVISGSEQFVKCMPEDNRETLLHIAARQGNVEVVNWLDAHNADAEERDSQDRTAFHIAVELGHIAILKYYFDNYSPKDPDHQTIYASPHSISVLSLALKSHDPEAVYMVLSSGLASSRDIEEAWSWVTSLSGRQTMQEYARSVSGDPTEKFKDIMQLLMQFGGFTPPPTPIIGQETGSQRSQPEDSSSKPTTGHFSSFHSKDHNSNEAARPTNRSTLHSHVFAREVPHQRQQRQTFFPNRGRGRGRGRGHGRGRGRGSSIPATA